MPTEVAYTQDDLKVFIALLKENESLGRFYTVADLADYKNQNIKEENILDKIIDDCVSTSIGDDVEDAPFRTLFLLYKEGAKHLAKVPLNRMPLYVNHKLEIFKAIAIWRLKIGK